MVEINTTESSHRRWAYLRHAVIGPLLASPPERGELAAAIRKLAEQRWRHPVTGNETLFQFSTIEAWYYQAKGSPIDPVGKLRWKIRSDLGKSRVITDALVSVIATLYKDFPFWSYQLMADNVKAKISQQPDLGPRVPSYQSIRRYMKLRGFMKMKKVRNWERPSVAAAIVAAAHQEIRSWEREYFNSLWHLDYHHGTRKVLTEDGTWVLPILLAIIDDHSRLVCHMQWYLNENTDNLVHGFCQALMKRQVPGELMEDNGSPMISKEFTAGLQACGIKLWRIRPASPYQNGKNEYIWTMVEGRLMAMLENYKDLTLKTLNDLTQAWVEMEYNIHFHSEIKTTPKERYLHSQDVGRPCPDSETLKLRFQREDTRKQRRSDGTISLEGRRFEIPSRFRHIERVTVKYAAWNLGFVHIVDPRSGEPMARIFPLDKIANSDGKRRQIENPVVLKPAPLTSTLPPLLQQLVDDYAATGLKPAYFPKDD